MKALQMEKQPSCWVETGVLVEWKNINPDMDYGIAPMVKRKNRSDCTGRLDLEY